MRANSIDKFYVIEMRKGETIEYFRRYSPATIIEIHSDNRFYYNRVGEFQVDEATRFPEGDKKKLYAMVNFMNACAIEGTKFIVRRVELSWKM